MRPIPFIIFLCLIVASLAAGSYVATKESEKPNELKHYNGLIERANDSYIRDVIDYEEYLFIDSIVQNYYFTDRVMLLNDSIITELLQKRIENEIHITE